ncbi:MAG: baseplate J/gp47 family protein [Candidatus Thorarchaeota archaeon]
MSVVNLYKHNARSYFDVYNALIAAYPRKPTWLFKEIGGFIDHSSELTNAIATDILYPMTRESAYAFAARCDYEPSEADGATDTLTITLTGAMSKTLLTGYQVGGRSLSTGEQVIWELTADGSSGGTDTIVVAAKQKRTYTSINIGVIDNNDDFADYPIDGYINIIKSTASLTIDSLTWSVVDNFDNSISTDRHFMILYQSSGRIRIRFGDGTTGLKPTINKTIFMTFETTAGLSGRMNAGEININVGQDSDISSITNAGSSGGSDAESISSIIRNARGNVRLKDVVWSKEDLETVARQASSSVQKALGIPGVGAASIHVVPSGGGTPSSGLLSTVQTYAISKSLFGVMPITASAPNYNTTNVTATITVRSGFTAATVEDLTEFALTLATSAIDNQVIEYYDDNGIDACRTSVINILWSWAFAEDENTALEFIIKKWKELLGTREYREWGQDLEVGDLWIMGNDLYDYGVDIFNLTLPTSNVSAASTEIIDAGTITVTS